MKKLRILCLHGYHGSASTLERQIQGLASAMTPHAELVFIDAPSISAGDFGWWHAKEESRGSDTDGSNPGVSAHKFYKGWQRSLEAIMKAFREQGPFDGVFGFSQGSALTGILTGLRAPDGVATPDKPLVFDFAMMVGGFPSADAKLARLYLDAESYDLPTVHIIGRSDSIVSPQLSRNLAEKFPSPLILEHSGGHVIANTDAVREGVGQFLQDLQRVKSGLVSRAAAT